MRVRILMIIGAMALALGLVGITLTLAQEATPSAQTEAEREAAAALALEANPPPAIRNTAVFTPPAAITAPLFVGVDEDATFTYLVDPTTAADYPLFNGFSVWGADYDPDGRRLFFNQGPTLHEWPLDASPVTLGLMKGSVSGANLSMGGLAYHDGVLYASRGLNSAADPEGIYTVDTATRSATVYITYSVPLEDVDIGGLAVDPATGDLYGTNDAADLRGLVRINTDGSLTVLAPYPAGEDDIDGLSIGDGRAYLVTDEPGPIHVFDFATLTYTTPLTNPWTTEELFAGAAWIDETAVLTPSIALTKTVGLDANTCATTSAITAPAGTEVTYCYEVLNTGSLTLTRHTLSDDRLGSILTDFPYTLAPGASAFITESAAITGTTVNTATWTAFNPGPTDMVTATATATVTVPPPAIELTKTVGIDPNTCAASTTITVTAGTDVTYCYRVLNTGGITLTQHNLDDSELGNLLNGFNYALVPEGSAFLTETATITQTTTNTATWTAYNPGPTHTVTATAAATVNVATIAAAPDIAVAPGSLAAGLLPNQQMTATVTISNTGDAALNWMVAFAATDCNAPGVLLWASAAPPNGTTSPGGQSEVVVTFDAGGAAAEELTGVLCVGSNDPDEPLVAVPLTLTVGQHLARLAIIIGSPAGE